MKQLEKYPIKNEELLNQVWTHKSCNKINNERLEFLGDAVLSLIIADWLMKKYPQACEGELTKRRSQLVSGSTLAKMATELDFSNFIKASESSFKNNPRILAGVLEAYIGAVYLESGLSSAENLIRSLFKDLIEQNLVVPNYKAILQEWCQKKYKELPVYQVQKEQGPEHKKTFTIDVFIQDRLCGTGSSPQKKQAEQFAAGEALKKLEISLKVS